MELGVFIFATEYTIRPDDLARALEERGFTSLFLPEHTHIPTSRRSPWPGGGELPKQYVYSADPFVSLSFAAAATERLRVGTGICLVPQRDPIVTAKEIATLDMLSGGRFDFGIGAGWNAEEMENHGTEFKDRFRKMVDRVKAMRTIWTEDEAQYHGEFVDFDPIWSYPKPVQRPHPPIILGGETVHTLRRVVEFCDGWFPRARAYDPVAGLEDLRRVADEAGRDMSTISVTVFGAPPDAQTLESYAAAGIDRALVGLPSEGRDDVLALLDQHAALVEGVG
jgi:probable F420-dependent oxidoreductase